MDKDVRLTTAGGNEESEPSFATDWTASRGVVAGLSKFNRYIHSMYSLYT